MIKKLYSRGFTLIEMTVSLVIAAILLLACGAAMRGLSHGYARVDENVEMDREARAVISQLRDDLAVAYRGGGFIHDDETGRVGWHGLMPESQQDLGRCLGDLCAVEYGLCDLQLDGDSGPVVRCLVRVVHDSADVFQAVCDGDVESPWMSESLFGDPLAQAVLEFSVRPLVMGVAGDWVDWQPDESAVPEALDLRLVVANRQLRMRLRTADDWDEAGSHWNEEERRAGRKVYQTILRFGVNES